MVYSLKTVLDTWLKLSTAQGSQLPDRQRQFLAAGTVLPLASFELAGNDHIKVALGVDSRGNPVQFKGRSGWFIYRPAVQILKDGQVILPTPPTPPKPAHTLRTTIDTWLKTTTAQGSTLPDAQRQFLSGGSTLPLANYEPAKDDHWRVTLGVDSQGKPVQFKGRSTWFIYRPATQIQKAGEVIPPTPPTPPAPVYSLKPTVDTWLKTTTAQGSALPDAQRQFITSDMVLPLESYGLTEDDHIRVALGVPFKGRNTWLVYRPAVQILKDGKAIDLNPPPKPTSGRINAKGIRLLKSFEGLELVAYQDAVGVWTIGYGTTSGVRPGMRITEAQAEELMRRDLANFEAAISRLVRVPLTEDQFSALVSFAYNVGSEALATSTLLRLLNQRDYRGAADQLLRWNRAGGQELAGLTRRRRAERALFLGEDYTAFL